MANTRSVTFVWFILLSSFDSFRSVFKSKTDSIQHSSVVLFPYVYSKPETKYKEFVKDKINFGSNQRNTRLP